MISLKSIKSTFLGNILLSLGILNNFQSSFFSEFQSYRFTVFLKLQTMKKRIIGETNYIELIQQ